MSYLRRQLVVSVLTANAVKPVPGAAVSIPAMFAGWFTSELAPHVIAGTLVDTALEARRPASRRSRTATLLAAANVAALAFVTQQGRRSRTAFEVALDEGLGGDHLDRLRQEYDDLDWRTPLRQLVWPFRMPAPGVSVEKDLVYDPRHGRRGKLDVYRPRDDADGVPPAPPQGRPVLLQVHGGAWSIGEKDHQGLPLMKHMASRGWVCVAPNYRLSPRSAFPDHLVDVKRALAWVRENIADHGGDPTFVAITGGSAGGHLAALAALTPNDPEYQPGFEDADTTVQAAVPFYGVYDFAGVTGSRAAERLRDGFLARRVMFADPETDREAFEKASPLLRVGPDAPPFYVIHGANDTLVEVGQARSFVRALREATDHPVAYSELAGTQHAFDVFPSVRSQHSVRSAERFLRWAYAAHRGEETGSATDWERSDPVDGADTRAS